MAIAVRWSGATFPYRAPVDRALIQRKGADAKAAANVTIERNRVLSVREREGSVPQITRTTLSHRKASDSMVNCMSAATMRLPCRSKKRATPA